MGLYKVIFLGLAVASPEEEARLLAGLQKKFNLTPERAERLLQKVPVVVKKGISKQEMERYVKAFEEIGGRTRVEEEEEILSEMLETSAEPVDKSYQERMTTCPQCGFEQPKADECVKCGWVLSKHAFQREATQQAGGKTEVISPQDRYVAWEGGEGFVRAFLKTTREALFSSSRFFKKVGSGEGYLSALIYGLICGIIGSGGTLVWQWYLLSQWVPLKRFSDLASSLYISLLIILVPMTILFSLILGSIVTHICLTIVGGNRRGFQTTFRTLSYAFSGNLFAIIPFIGSSIGWIYFLILTIIGLREGHSISTGKAVLAVSLPLIIGVGLIILGMSLMPFFIRSLGIFTGLGV